MNFMNLAGHLGADPEARFTSSGQKVTTLRVAARCRKSGSDDNTIWWRVTVWGEQFDKMISYFKKGSSIIVMGELNKPEIFTDREGKPQISMSMTASNLMFSPFGRSDRSQESLNSNENNVTEKAGIASGQKPLDEQTSSVNATDEEIPF